MHEMSGGVKLNLILQSGALVKNRRAALMLVTFQ